MKCLAIALAFLSAACEQHVQIVPTTHPPVDVVLENDAVKIPAGVAIGCTAALVVDGTADKRARVSFAPSLDGIIGIDPTLDEHGFVFYGKRPGAAIIQVQVDGEPFGAMSATVTAQ